MGKQKNIKKAVKLTFTGAVINFFLAIVKGVAGIVGHSQALIADAIESVSDVFTSFVVLLGIKVASREPSKRFPYGMGKAEAVAGIGVAIMLTAAGIFIVLQSIENIGVSHEGPAPFTLAVLPIVVLIKEVLFRYSFRLSEETASTAVKADAFHHRSDAITSGAAFIGILIAVLGGEGYENADDWAALVAACFIFYNAWITLKPSLREILDASPSEEFIHEVRAIAEEVEGVKGTDKCYIRKMGVEYYVDMHVVVDGAISVKEGHHIAHKVKDRILQKKPSILNVFVHIEPYNPDYINED